MSNDDLPPPDVDIRQTRYFRKFKVPAGPHLEALLYNQATALRMQQDIRNTLSQLAPGAGRGLKTSSAVAGPVTTGDEELVDEDFDARAEIEWLAEDTTKNKFAKNRSNKILPAVAISLFEFFKSKLASHWSDTEEEEQAQGEVQVQDSNDEKLKELDNSLKPIVNSAPLKVDLHIALSKLVNPSQGRKRKRKSDEANNDDNGEIDETATAEAGSEAPQTSAAAADKAKRKKRKSSQRGNTADTDDAAGSSGPPPSNSSSRGPGDNSPAAIGGDATMDTWTVEELLADEWTDDDSTDTEEEDERIEQQVRKYLTEDRAQLEAQSFSHATKTQAMRILQRNRRIPEGLFEQLDHDNEAGGSIDGGDVKKDEGGSVDEKMRRLNLNTG